MVKKSLARLTLPKAIKAPRAKELMQPAGRREISRKRGSDQHQKAAGWLRAVKMPRTRSARASALFPGTGRRDADSSSALAMWDKWDRSDDNICRHRVSSTTSATQPGQRIMKERRFQNIEAGGGCRKWVLDRTSSRAGVARRSRALFHGRTVTSAKVPFPLGRGDAP